jgi:cytosine/adenosine deaminase-related metal-dependent hydrolase
MKRFSVEEVLNQPMKITKQVLVFVIFLLFLHMAAMAAQGPEIVLQGGKVYSSPTANAIDNAVVLIRDGQIAAVGKRGELKVPKSALVIDCTGKIVVAGFWNSHVHFETGWQGAATVPPRQT